MTHLSRRALGAPAVSPRPLLADRPCRRPLVRPPRGRPRPLHREGADQRRLRRRGHLRRPRGLRGGAPRAQARRQRRRRGGRDGGRARRHRALQLRHRRRRLLRLLRRDDRPGAHHRRPRDRAGVDAARRVHRPEHRRALQLHARAGHQRRLRRRARARLATWERALDRWGTMSLGRTFRPAIHVARRGFMVDQTFRQQTLENQNRFDAFSSTRRLFLPGGDAPPVGSVFRNPALATTYRQPRPARRRLLLRRRARPPDRPRSSSTRRRRRRRRCRCRPGSCSRPTCARYRRSTAGRPTSATAGTTSTAWRRRRPAARRSARR